MQESECEQDVEFPTFTCMLSLLLCLFLFTEMQNVQNYISGKLIVSVGKIDF